MISRFHQPQFRFSLRGFFRSGLLLPLPHQLFVEDVVFGPDRVDDEKDDDRFFPFFCGFETLHPLLVFFPEGGEGGLVEAEDLLRQSVE